MGIAYYTWSLSTPSTGTFFSSQDSCREAALSELNEWWCESDGIEMKPATRVTSITWLYNMEDVDLATKLILDAAQVLGIKKVSVDDIPIGVDFDSYYANKPGIRVQFNTTFENVPMVWYWTELAARLSTVQAIRGERPQRTTMYDYLKHAALRYRNGLYNYSVYSAQEDCISTLFCWIMVASKHKALPNFEQILEYGGVMNATNREDALNNFMGCSMYSSSNLKLLFHDYRNDCLCKICSFEKELFHTPVIAVAV